MVAIERKRREVCFFRILSSRIDDRECCVKEKEEYSPFYLEWSLLTFVPLSFPLLLLLPFLSFPKRFKTQ